MATFNIFKEKTLPVNLKRNSMYLISKDSDPTYVEIYITGKTTDVIRRVINSNDVQAMIADALGNITTDGIRVLNGKTGESVTLDYADVGADASGSALAVKNELTPLINDLSNNKLDKIDYVQHYRGLFSSLIALMAAIPTALDGDYAHIDTGIGNDRQTAIWDGDDSKWVISSSSGGSVSNTDEVPEGNLNKYFTSDRVRNTTINNVSLTNSPINVGDTYENALGKLQEQINNGTGGGGSYEVKELNLVDSADSIPSSIKITPDVNNVIVGTNINGVIELGANETNNSAYFQFKKGSFDILVDFSLQETVILEIVHDEPTVATTFFSQQNNPDYVGIAVTSQGSIMSVLVGDLYRGIGAIVQIFTPLPVETVTFVLTETTIDIYNKSNKIGSYTHDGNLGTYYHTMCEIGFPNTDKFRYNLTNTYEEIVYKLPDDAKDGDTYHLTTDGELFNKLLLVDDYITVYGNKTNVSIVRIPKPLEFKKTRLKLPITLFNQNAADPNGLQAYYDTELNSVFLSGQYYFTELVTVEFPRCFEIDVTSIPLYMNLRAYNTFSYNRSGNNYLYVTLDSGIGKLIGNIDFGNSPQQYVQYSVPCTRILGEN